LAVLFDAFWQADSATDYHRRVAGRFESIFLHHHAEQAGHARDGPAEDGDAEIDIGEHAVERVGMVAPAGAGEERFEPGAEMRRGGDAEVEQIDLARSILGDRLVSVQNQFSPQHTSTMAELEHCAELGLAFLPWSPLGGIGRASQVGATQSAMSEIARAREVSPYQVVLAWELALAPVVIPIPGASRPSSITDSALAADLELDPSELVRIDNYLV